MAKLNKVIVSILMLSVLSACNFNNNQKLTRLTTPKVEKISNQNNVLMSKKTFDSYLAFVKKFTSLMMEVNNKEDEQSLAISIPDAYLCFAITGAISDDAARKDVLSYLELNDVTELRTSVKEIISTLATLYKNSDGKLCGGYNLNSIWLNPEKVFLVKEKDEELYKDLEEIYDASLYMEALTSKKANQYLKDNGLKDMPTPEIVLDDNDPSALNVMSVYYCLDYFPESVKKNYRSQFKSGKHKMDYYLNNSTSKVDYIEQSNDGYVFENDCFYGATMSIGYLNMAYFLPNDKTALPSTIMDDVLDENYQLKESTYVDHEGNEQQTYLHKTNISAPYFSLNNQSKLEHKDLLKILPIISRKGAGERIAYSEGEDLYLSWIKQFSVTKFNYDGFYSCSVTISGKATSSEPIDYEKFNLVLDHPYVFEVRKNVKVGEEYINLPIIIGEIVNPEYVD